MAKLSKLYWFYVLATGCWLGLPLLCVMLNEYQDKSHQSCNQRKVFYVFHSIFYRLIKFKFWFINCVFDDCVLVVAFATETSVKKEKRQFPNLLSLQDNWNGNWKKIIFFASILKIENFVIKMEENMKVNFKKWFSIC